MLMLSVDIHELWPTMDEEQCHLYDLARQILPKHNRSKDPIRVEYMHSFGIKQLGLSDTANNSILLKMIQKNDEGVNIYTEFREVAVLFYGKQEALERVIAPDNHALQTEPISHHTEELSYTLVSYLKLFNVFNPTLRALGVL